MSDDLIKRTDAIEAIEVVDWYHQNRNKDMVSGANSDEHQAWYKADDIYKALEAVPSADRPQGEWIERIGGISKELFYQCSKCYGEVDTDEFDYCPWCGSRNREENDR